MKRHPKVHINAWLETSLLKRVQRESRVQGVSVSALMRMALRSYLNGGRR